MHDGDGPVQASGYIPHHSSLEPLGFTLTVADACAWENGQSKVTLYDRDLTAEKPDVKILKYENDSLEIPKEKFEKSRMVKLPLNRSENKVQAQGLIQHPATGLQKETEKMITFQWHNLSGFLLQKRARQTRAAPQFL